MNETKHSLFRRELQELTKQATSLSIRMSKECQGLSGRDIIESDLVWDEVHKGLDWLEDLTKK